MSSSSIVNKTDSGLKITAFDIEPFDKDAEPNGMHFDLCCEVETGEGYRNRAVVSNTLPGWGTFEFHTDEGKVGKEAGDDSAPSPLHYFTAGSAFCFLSHLIYSARSLKLVVRNMRVQSRIRYRTNYNPFRGSAQHPRDSFGWAEFQELHVLIDSEESEEDLLNLVKWSSQACMAENALARNTPVESHLHVNGKQVS